MKLIIVHPGIQHSPRLANGALRTGLFERVTLMTSMLFKPSQKVMGLLRKRIKPIDEEIIIVNHYLYSLLYLITKFLYNKVFVNPENQSHNNPIYFWQQVFGYLCLPRIYLNKKNLLVICFETTGWPIVKYCKKWNIPVVMDFASISHEKAKTLGINETQYGINLKVKERAFIDYGFYCSEFCLKSFEGLTSTKRDVVLYLGAEASTPLSLTKEIQESGSKNQDVCGVENVKERQESSSKNQDACGVGNAKEMKESSNKNQDLKKTQYIRHKTQDLNLDSIKISFIANLEYRKGLDIFLESIYSYEYPIFLEIHLIGRIRESWVAEHLPKQILNNNIKLIYKPAMSQEELFNYLQYESFDLNVQCSRFDSFAMVVPETMMQGIPNVVSPFVGAGEMLKNGVDGFIMEKLDSQSLKDLLTDYMALSTQERIALKAQVLNSSKEMIWENYYANLALALKEIIANVI